MVARYDAVILFTHGQVFMIDEERLSAGTARKCKPVDSVRTWVSEYRARCSADHSVGTKMGTGEEVGSVPTNRASSCVLLVAHDSEKLVASNNIPPSIR